jgi:hypothetical protein
MLEGERKSYHDLIDRVFKQIRRELESRQKILLQHVASQYERRLNGINCELESHKEYIQHLDNAATKYSGLLSDGGGGGKSKVSLPTSLSSASKDICA